MTGAQQTATKVLYATFGCIPAPSGAACWSTEIIRELTRHYDVDGLSLKTEELSHIERYHRARLLRVPVGEISFLEQIKTYQRALRRQLSSDDYALCHFTSIWEGMVLATQKKALGYRMVFHVSSLPSLDFKLNYPEAARYVETSYSLKQQEERCLSVSDHILAGSQLIGEHLRSRGVPDHKITVVPAGIDLTPFDSADNQSGQAGTILYLGSLKPWQGVIGLLQALADMPRHIRFRLLIVSPKEEPGYRETKGKLQLLGLARNVEFIEPVPLDQLAPIIRQAAVCIAPLANHDHNRRAASIPHKVLCYMAAGRPVIASSQPAVKELLDDNVTALLYSPGDIHGLQDAIQKVLLDRDLARQLANQARFNLEERFPIRRSLDLILSRYRDLLGEKAEGPSVPDDSADRDTPLVQALDTRKVVDLEYADTGSQLCHDTDPGLSGRPLPDTDPSGQPLAESAMVFGPAEDQPTAPRRIINNPDDWQVQEAREIDLLERRRSALREEAEEAQAEPALEEQDTGPRFLLGGPSYRVEEEESLKPDTGKSKESTERAGTPLGAKSSLPLLSDEDVELAEPDD